MLEVEGGTLKSCMRLVRHECGHAVDNAFQLRRRRGRATSFGRSDVPYPEFYAPKPFSRRFVRHLEGGYAQSHPDEDFAETFAVWLDPESGWRERYRSWPALDKLGYVDGLMMEISGETPRARNRRRPGRLASLRGTLDEHYRRKRARYKVDFAEHYDEDLERIFTASGGTPAAAFLRARRSYLRAHVASWTGARRYTVDGVVQDWIGRARAKRLFANGDDAETTRQASTALAVRVMEYLHGGHYRVAL